MACKVLAGNLTEAARDSSAMLCRKYIFPQPTPPPVNEIVTFDDDQIVTFAGDDMVVI